MNTAKIYYDADDNECSIHQMVKREPDWAANRIQEGERAEVEVGHLRDAVSFLLKFVPPWARDVPEGLSPLFYGTLTAEGDRKVKARVDHIEELFTA